MKKLSIYVLAISFALSVALNVRLVMLYEDAEEDRWVEYFKTFHKDDEVYYYLENGKVDKAKEVLSDSLKTKGMLFFIFAEEGALSEEAINEIQENKFVPEEEI